MKTYIFSLQTGSNGVYGKSTYEQEAESVEQAVSKLFAAFQESGLLAYFVSLEHIGTESEE
jgi:hypothetical protein